MKIYSQRILTAQDLPAVKYTTLELVLKRQLRAPLLAAFDIYKSNVLYGITEETAAEHESVVRWYRAALALEDEAVLAPPHVVAQYLVQGGE